MATNGGIIGKSNRTSFGKCVVTSKTSTAAITTQPGTRLAQVLVVAGGASGGTNYGGGGGAGGLRCAQINVCGGTPYTATVGGGGAVKGPESNANGNAGNTSTFSKVEFGNKLHTIIISENLTQV